MSPKGQQGRPPHSARPIATGPGGYNNYERAPPPTQPYAPQPYNPEIPTGPYNAQAMRPPPPMDLRQPATGNFTGRPQIPPNPLPMVQ